MTYRLAINGFGRIGRCVLRALQESGHKHAMEIVAVNELADLKTMAHLLKYDSTHGRFPGQIQTSEGCLVVDDRHIVVSHCEQPQQIPWTSQSIDLLLECSGTFSDRSMAEVLLCNGVRRLLYSHPAEQDQVDATIVYGINETLLKTEHRIISNASCTTNGVAPLIRILHDSLGIVNGTITTIHSAMNDQPVIDAYHHTDLRKTRAAGHSVIPVETGLARGLDRIFPELTGRFTAQALRVPTLNVSAMDLVVWVERDTDEHTVNQLLRAASDVELNGILAVSDEPLASCDYNHDPHSAVVDAGQTRVSGKRLVKVLIWFDNEWGYANRMLDVASYLMQLDKPA